MSCVLHYALHRVLHCVLHCVLVMCVLGTGEARTTDAPVTTTSSHSHPELGCQDGWVLHQKDHQRFCLLYSPEVTAASFVNARDQCQAMGGGLLHNTQEVNLVDSVMEHVISHEGDFWIGLKKAEGFTSSYTWLHDSKEDPDDIPSHLVRFQKDEEQCVFLSSFSEDWEADDCNHEYRYICMKQFECPEGRFGEQCERECHCLTGTCHATPEGPVCASGCHRGWLGGACDRARQPVEVNYYCLRADPGKNAVQIRVKTNGIETITISKIMHGRVEACLPTSNWPHQHADTYTLFVPANTNVRRPFGHNETHFCGGYGMTGGRHTWRVKVQENVLLDLEHDLDVNISCVFKGNATLVSHSDFKVIDHRPSATPVTGESVEGDVTLTLVSVQSGRPVVREVAMGTPVFLRLDHGLAADSKVKDILPTSCTVLPQHDVYLPLTNRGELRFTDIHGCPVKDSPIPPFTRSGSGLQTEWFPLFGLQGVSNLRFACQLYLCFTHTDCQEARRYCQKKGRGRKGRRRQTRDVTGRHVTSQTVSVVNTSG